MKARRETFPWTSLAKVRSRHHALMQSSQALFGVATPANGAAERLNLHQAQLVNQGCGLAVLAVIDTGVDPEHELLKGSCRPGFRLHTESGRFCVGLEQC